MTIDANELQTLCELAYLDSDSDQGATLIEEISSIIDFVEQLKAVNTQAIDPLYHPIEQANSPLRDDIMTETDHSEALANIAPSFENGLYQVPQVIGEELE